MRFAPIIAASLLTGLLVGGCSNGNNPTAAQSSQAATVAANQAGGVSTTNDSAVVAPKVKVAGLAGEIDSKCQPYEPKGDIYASVHGDDSQSLAPKALKDKAIAAGLTYYLGYRSGTYAESWIVKRPDANESCVRVVMWAPGIVVNDKVDYDLGKMRVVSMQFIHDVGGSFGAVNCESITPNASTSPEEALQILNAAVLTAWPLVRTGDYKTESGKPGSMWSCIAVSK